MRVFEVVAALARVSKVGKAGGTAFGQGLDMFDRKGVWGKGCRRETILTAPAGALDHRPLLMRGGPAIRHRGAGSGPARPSWPGGEPGAIGRAPGPVPAGGRSRARLHRSVSGAPRVHPG